MKKEHYFLIAIFFCWLGCAFILVKSEKKLEFSNPTVSQCKQAVDIAIDVLPLVSFEKGGDKLFFIKRIYDMTQETPVRIYAEYVATVIYVTHNYIGYKDINQKLISESKELFVSSCNKFEL